MKRDQLPSLPDDVILTDVIRFEITIPRSKEIPLNITVSNALEVRAIAYARVLTDLAEALARDDNEKDKSKKLSKAQREIMTGATVIIESMGLENENQMRLFCKQQIEVGEAKEDQPKSQIIKPDFSGMQLVKSPKIQLP